MKFNQQPRREKRMSNTRYELLAEDLEKQGINVSEVKQLLQQQHIETLEQQ